MKPHALKMQQKNTKIHTYRIKHVVASPSKFPSNAKMTCTFLLTVGANDNFINKIYHKRIKKGLKDTVHQAHESCWHISQPKKITKNT